MNTKAGCRILAASALTVAVFAAIAANAQAALVINEFWADDAYGDTAEYIELYNNGGSAETLDGLSVIVVDGDTGGSTASGNYKRVNQQYDLTGSLAAGGYLLIGAGTAPYADITFTLDDFENGSQTIAIVLTADIAYDPPGPPTNRKLTDASLATITTYLATQGDAVATVDDGGAADHVYFGATNIGGFDATNAWDTASRIPNGFDNNLPGNWQTQHNYTLAIELGDANDALASPKAANGNPSTKWGACCDGVDCTYGLATACVSPDVYQGNWRACAPVNPCDRPCETIQDAKDAPLNTAIQICDVVVTNMVDVVNDAGLTAYHVQDASGPGGVPRGIVVFGDSDLIEDTVFDGVAVGDVISLQGTTAVDDNFNLELTDDATLALERTAGPTAGSLPAPYVVTCADVITPSIAEPLESVRVKLNCVEFLNAGGSFTGGKGYTVTDGTASCSVYVPNSSTVWGTIPSGMVSVVGIISQYRPYEILLLNYPNGGGDIGAPDCASGACCLPDASCVILSEALCEGYHYGIYRGGTCPPTPDCEVILTGACWIPGSPGQCQLLVEGACDAAGGGWAGANVPCSALKTIAEVRALPYPPPGTDVYIKEALVISLTDITNGANITYHLQDNSGPNGEARGIAIYGDPNSPYFDLPTLASEGDRVMVRGTTENYGGMLEFDGYDGPSEIIKVWDGPGVPFPRQLDLADLLDSAYPLGEDVESTFIELNCVQFVAAGGTFAGGGAGGNFYIKDQLGNQIIARVGASDNPLVGQTIPSGFMNIRGIASQYDTTVPLVNGYQIQLRKMSELSLPCGTVCQTCGGDFNTDNVVDFNDLAYVSELIDALLGTDPTPNPCADINEDEDMDGEDIAEFVARVIPGYDCLQPPAGTIEVIRCDDDPNSPDYCPTEDESGNNRFCMYIVEDNAYTQGLLAGYPSCIGQINQYDNVCILVPCEPEPGPYSECAANNGSYEGADYQIFRWGECYFGAYRVSPDCNNNCVGWATMRFRVAP